MNTPLEVLNDLSTRALTVRWPAGHMQTVTHTRLRAACPCANCRRRRLGGATLADQPDVTLIAIEPMGYGMQLAFSDGHARGIYPWSYIEQLGGEVSVGEAWKGDEERARLRADDLRLAARKKRIGSR